ncbi:hypothetical protein D1AOALGA4SA_2212 [Olavius algarvensis Delta 1 endosymbiont]|nr:hypothetical protein D1AOALGA4SA_2212 [Olavius algarvensis Delta 1 endosymbiont]
MPKAAFPLPNSNASDFSHLTSYNKILLTVISRELRHSNFKQKPRRKR